jgi:hypothetical protein
MPAADPTTDLSVLNEALTLLGEPPLAEWSQAITPAEAAALQGTPAAVGLALFRPVQDELEGGHPWLFNKRVSSLVRASGVPHTATGFSAHYTLPTGLLRLVVPFVDDVPAASWEVANDKLLIDALPTEDVALEHHVRVGPAHWRPGFRMAVVAALAARMCLPITENEARAKGLEAQAQMLLARARHQNASERPVLRLPTGRLAARMRRR